MAPTSVENASKSLEEINNDNVEQNTMSSFTCLISTTKHRRNAQSCQYCQLKYTAICICCIADSISFVSTEWTKD